MDKDSSYGGVCVAMIQRQPDVRIRHLDVVWEFDGGERILTMHEQAYSDNDSHQSPADLGRGFAITDHVSPRTNHMIALFRCGENRPSLSIDFAPVVRGRDAVQDMFAFMRIAQKRFGEIHDCTPRAA